MQLTKNFSLEEFKVSKDYPNLLQDVMFTEADTIKAFLLCALFLQPVRDVFGPVTILSGKRSFKLNSAVGGQPNSDHLYTPNTSKAAVDFTCTANMKDVYEHIKNTRAKVFGQMILYTKSNFIHISLPTPEHLGDVWEVAK